MLQNKKETAMMKWNENYLQCILWEDTTLFILFIIIIS